MCFSLGTKVQQTILIHIALVYFYKAKAITFTTKKNIKLKRIDDRSLVCDWIMKVESPFLNILS
jgi:hypothetical protein